MEDYMFMLIYTILIYMLLEFFYIFNKKFREIVDEMFVFEEKRFSNFILINTMMAMVSIMLGCLVFISIETFKKYTYYITITLLIILGIIIIKLMLYKLLRYIEYKEEKENAEKAKLLLEQYKEDFKRDIKQRRRKNVKTNKKN